MLRQFRRKIENSLESREMGTRIKVRVNHTLQHLTLALTSDDMGPIAREHVTAAHRGLMMQKVHVVEDADKEVHIVEKTNEEAEEEVPLFGPVEVVEVAPLPELVEAVEEVPYPSMWRQMRMHPCLSPYGR
ncbi:hypothetical protein AMTR_s00213p00012540 [Amborella trichopoda]|uniref:Uncharacterized protein n=1 Tax=Amborella trichopoda TaxID=13333 RepID=W1P3G9_AMBTC|nr:hypothetical protein AMTR_s00213p00012540 [Amborella trichopoda]